MKEGRIAGEDDEANFLLPHVHSTLEFLYSHLEEERHFGIVSEELMAAAEEEMGLAFREASRCGHARHDGNFQRSLKTPFKQGYQFFFQPNFKHSINFF